MKESISAALDVGTTKISLTLGKVSQTTNSDLAGMDIIAHSYISSRGVVNGTVQNIDRLTENINFLLNEVKGQCGIELKEVETTLGTPLIKHDVHHAILIKENANEEISEDDVESMHQDMFRVVMPPGQNILHVIPQQYVLDHENEVRDPVGCSAVKVEGTFKVISVDANALKRLERGINKAGLHIKHILLQPLSSSVAVLSQEEKIGGVCLVDIGGGTTDIAIFKDQQLRHISSIPIGSNAITQDLKKGLILLEEEAERVKVSFGKAMVNVEDGQSVLSVPPIKTGSHKMIPALNISAIIESRMVEILELVHMEILSSGVSLNAGIVLTGGGAMLKDITKLAQFVCGQFCRVGYPTERINFKGFPEANSPRFAASIGLAKDSIFPDDYPWSREKIVSQKFKVKNVISPRKPFNPNLNFQKVTEKLRRILLDDVQYEY